MTCRLTTALGTVCFKLYVAQLCVWLLTPEPPVSLPVTLANSGDCGRKRVGIATLMCCRPSIDDLAHRLTRPLMMVDLPLPVSPHMSTVTVTVLDGLGGVMAAEPPLQQNCLWGDATGCCMPVCSLRWAGDGCRY